METLAQRVSAMILSSAQLNFIHTNYEIRLFRFSFALYFGLKWLDLYSIQFTSQFLSIVIFLGCLSVGLQIDIAFISIYFFLTFSISHKLTFEKEIKVTHNLHTSKLIEI